MSVRKISANGTNCAAQRSQGIEYFDSFNTKFKAEASTSFEILVKLGKTRIRPPEREFQSRLVYGSKTGQNIFFIYNISPARAIDAWLQQGTD